MHNYIVETYGEETNDRGYIIKKEENYVKKMRRRYTHKIYIYIYIYMLSELKAKTSIKLGSVQVRRKSSSKKINNKRLTIHLLSRITNELDIRKQKTLH